MLETDAVFRARLLARVSALSASSKDRLVIQTANGCWLDAVGRKFGLDRRISQGDWQEAT